MLYKHVAGPYKGGLNVTYDNVPYYPIRVREKMGKNEPQPLNQLTRNQADRYLILRTIKNHR